MIKNVLENPSNITICRVKDLFFISKEKAHQENPVVLSLARDAIKIRDISNNEGQLAESYENYNPVKIGDLLLNPMDLYSGANCNMSLVEGVISPAYINLRRKYKDINPKFYDYYFKIQYWTMNMFAHGKGVSFDNRWTINTEGILNFDIPYITIDEQNKIVEKVDKKCSQIDDLIKLQEKEIEKLKEYKQSAITEVVTKGLYPNAKMKESGIKWIGKVPINWQILRLKFIASIQGGVGFPEDLQGKNEGDFPFYKNSDINGQGCFVKTAKNYVTLQDVELNKWKIILRDSILFGKIGEAMKKNHRKISLVDCLIDNNMSSLRIKKHKNCKIMFLYFILKSIDMIAFDNGGTIPSLNTSKLMNHYIAFPPFKEQDKIIHYLEKKIRDIDRIIEHKKLKVEKLLDYKKSLIYEYVTGKKRCV